ncbi:hypothetical protein PAXINDRAFT_13956 [Paxillus involutus ATCC 200175]|uniref:WD40 repeat-like protein n=1 Tax=Paxillus involutus ATCC 200175 TaxID=664439 RepID=A0A0C9TCD0_PAXIN|nr:hypothetical protein PAXINDRAFT_13956 [Paxillus involutus ATCC 200175]
MGSDGQIKHALDTGPRYVNSICFSPDGTKLASGHNDGMVRMFDVETGDLILGPIEAIGDPLTGHTAFVNSISLSPDGTKLASALTDKTVRFWDTDSSDPIGEPLQHEDMVMAVTFSQSGEFIACGEYGGNVSIWHVPWWDDSKKEANKSLLDLASHSFEHATSQDAHPQPDTKLEPKFFSENVHQLSRPEACK